MEYARERKHHQVVELLEMAEIRIALRAKRLADEDAMVELVDCGQVRSVYPIAIHVCGHHPHHHHHYLRKPVDLLGLWVQGQKGGYWVS